MGKRKLRERQEAHTQRKAKPKTRWENKKRGIAAVLLHADCGETMYFLLIIFVFCWCYFFLLFVNRNNMSVSLHLFFRARRVIRRHPPVVIVSSSTSLFVSVLSNACFLMLFLLFFFYPLSHSLPHTDTLSLSFLSLFGLRKTLGGEEKRVEGRRPLLLLLLLRCCCCYRRLLFPFPVPSYLCCQKLTLIV